MQSKRYRDLVPVVQANGWRLVQDTTMRMLDGSCLYDLANEGRNYANHIFGNEWEYAEVSFAGRGRKGLSRLKYQTIHYSVMRIPLPRRLPNVVFDSLRHQQRQFRIMFDKAQHIELEGDFNQYFATYFGTDYTIDDLSFITPEVMEAMLEAQDYDIEIVHDSLLLFGPVKSDAKSQLEEMDKAIHLIRKKLLNNILTYRDERLPYHEGRKIVAHAGMFLERKPFGTFVTLIILAIVYLLPIIVIVSLLYATFVEP